MLHRVRRRRARGLQALARRRRAQGRYGEAERLQQRALDHAERGLGVTHPELVGFLNDYGMTCKYAGRFDDGERAYRRALAIVESAPAVDEVAVATLHHNLGGIAHARGDSAAAEPHARRAAEMREQALGSAHPDLAADLAALAPIVHALGRVHEADRLLRRALHLFESALGADHYEVGMLLSNLAALRQDEGRLDEAARLYARALAIKERTLTRDHPEIATTLNNLGVLEKRRGNGAEAAALLRRAVTIFERQLAPEHPTLEAARGNLASLSGRQAAPEIPSFPGVEVRRMTVPGPSVASTAALLGTILVLGSFLGGCDFQGGATDQPSTFVVDDFESGRLSDWKFVGSGSGSWFVYSDGGKPPDPARTDPNVPFNMPDPPQGEFAAVADTNGPGTRILYRDVRLESRFTLHMTVFYAGTAPFSTPKTLAHDVPEANQQFRIDLIRPSAPIDSLAKGDVLVNVLQTYQGEFSTGSPKGVRVDVSRWAGQTVRLRRTV